MGFYSIGNCRHYDDALVTPIPALLITAETPSRRARQLLETPIDTGFAGFVLTPAGIYAKLSEAELPEEYFATYSTLAGPVRMRRAKVRITVFDKAFHTFIETPIAGVGKLLLGRRLLNSLHIALLGPALQTCELVPSNSARPR